MRMELHCQIWEALTQLSESSIMLYMTRGQVDISTREYQIELKYIQTVKLSVGFDQIFTIVSCNQLEYTNVIIQ
jgi:hypothetical protein